MTEDEIYEAGFQAGKRAGREEGIQEALYELWEAEDKRRRELIRGILGYDAE